MSISMTPQIEQLIQHHLSAGSYESEQAVLLDALRALAAEKEVVAAAAAGYEQYRSGQHRSWEEADADFRRTNGLPPAS